MNCRLFSFLIHRPPPSSLTFPYTTLFRSHPRAEPRTLAGHFLPGFVAVESTGQVSTGPRERRAPETRHPQPRGRSEEHTSELQSQSNLVCRLLLEKKNHETAQRPTAERSQ